MRKIYALFFGLLLLTQVDAQTILAEGFETAVPPTGWTRINEGSSPNDWTRYSSSVLSANSLGTAQEGSYAAGYLYDGSAAANNWLISPAINLTAGTSYTISFFYKTGSYPEKLKVTIGNSATTAAQTTVLWNNAGGADLRNTAWAQATATYTPSATGPFHVGLHVYSDPDQYIMLVDNFKVEVTPSSVPNCTAPLTPADAATNVSIPSASFSWNTAAGAATYDFYFGTSNPPTTLLSNTANTNITVNGLASNTTYYWYVVPRNAAGPATGCATSVRSFTTETVTPPANDECANAIALNPYTGTANYYTISGTASAGVTPCATDPGTPDEDVWFNFTAVQNGNATITVVGASTFDAVLQAFSGTCGSLSQLGSCVDATVSGGTEILNLTGLVAGQTYYLRVYDYSNGYGDRFTVSVSGTALPVLFTNLTGRSEGRNNLLNWSTATETNNVGFELERSADGKSFSKIAFVASKGENGNSNSSLSYNYNDEKPLSGTNYYRLKQIDKDGKYSYSDIVALKNRATDFRISSLYPNPAKAEVKMVITATNAGRATIVVTDLSGKVISQTPTQLMIGDNIQNITVQSLATGTYMVKVITGAGLETAVQRFVKN